MPVPYRRTPRSAEEGCAAFLDVVWLHSAGTFYGALLLLDGRGQPLEFVHNTLTAPSGFLWPEERVATLGTATLSHSLFDACRREPDLLVCLPTLGRPDFCRTEIAPAIPLAQVATGKEDGAPDAWSWINSPPAAGMRASVVAQELTRRGFALEPFQRLRRGLRELYPSAPWHEMKDDPLLP